MSNFEDVKLFMKTFSEFLGKYNASELKTEIVIFGAGTIGRLTFGALKEKNINADYFCDSDLRKQKSKIEEIEVISPKTLYGFDASNITLGLPFLRITVDHGPNQNMLGKGTSSTKSLENIFNFINSFKWI